MFEGLRKIVQKRTQLHFRDDGMFEFRKLEIEDGFLAEKQQQMVTAAWLMIYKLQKRFRGYGKIGSDMVTISFDRDIVLDPFDQLSDAEKPEKGNDLKKKFVKNIATAKCYRHEHGKKPKTLMDKLVMYMGTAIVLEVLIIGMQAAMGASKGG